MQWWAALADRQRVPRIWPPPLSKQLRRNGPHFFHFAFLRNRAKWFAKILLRNAVEQSAPERLEFDDLRLQELGTDCTRL